MTVADLKGIADQVIRRAQKQGYVVPREVREELTQAGASDDLWKDVVALARQSLTLRRGRYYYSAPVSDRVRQEQSQQQGVRRAVDQLLRDNPAAAAPVERRGQDRIDFVQTVTVRTEDGAEFTLLSRDLSANGIRLVGTRRLLGQKVHVLVPRPGGEPPYDFLARILWTCAVGDGLFENGGALLEVNHE
jgi:PilZ domain-containing protein